MPDNLKPHVEKARARHERRHASPGVEVAVERVTGAYTLSSPHSDQDAWEVMVFDAIGTRSKATATVFLTQLTELCSKAWHPDEGEGGGEWYPDADELNMILNIVASVRPRNEMEAALAAQMVAVHLMTMKASKAALEGWSMIDPRTAAIAGKLARTFVMQMDALARAKGKKTTRQTIKVSHEKHVHHHQHVHVDRGASDLGGQPHEARGASEPAERPALPCPEQVGEVVRFPGSEREEGLPPPRRDKPGRA